MIIVTPEVALPDWIGISIPIHVAVVGWLANEWRKRTGEERQRREERYRFLIEHARGFYVGTQNEADKARFLEEVNLSWLYCPDEIIRAMYAFLDTVKTGARVQPGDAEDALNRLVLAMRKDLWSLGFFRRTRLEASEYRHFAPSERTRTADSAAEAGSAQPPTEV